MERTLQRTILQAWDKVRRNHKTVRVKQDLHKEKNQRGILSIREGNQQFTITTEDTEKQIPSETLVTMIINL